MWALTNTSVRTTVSENRRAFKYCKTQNRKAMGSECSSHLFAPVIITAGCYVSGLFIELFRLCAGKCSLKSVGFCR